MSEWRLPLSALEYDNAEEQAVAGVLRSRWLSMGSQVEAFEREFAAFTESKHAVAVANGTAALHLAFKVLGIGPGDEVIQPAVNFVAAANMTREVGAMPVFVDISSLDQPTIDAQGIEAAITSRTKAAVVMHYGGYFPNMSQIHEICRKRQIFIIEDACHAVGARYLDPNSIYPHGRMAGNLGDIACFSFFSNKNLAVGEGGMLTTNSGELDTKLRLLRSHGMTALTWDRFRGHAESYDVLMGGCNYRLDEIRAVLGRVQLQKLPSHNERRRTLVLEYRRRLGSLADWTIPFETYHGESACHLAVMVAPDEESRRGVVQELRNERIQTSLHYPCIPDFKAFELFKAARLPHSRAYARRTISLPLFPGMTESDVELVCGSIRRHIQ